MCVRSQIVWRRNAEDTLRVVGLSLLIDEQILVYLRGTSNSLKQILSCSSHLLIIYFFYYQSKRRGPSKKIGARYESHLRIIRKFISTA